MVSKSAAPSTPTVCDDRCFLPLYIFVGSQLLAYYLRPGNKDAHSIPVSISWSPADGTL